MFDVRHVVAGVDSSEEGAAALRFALGEAARRGVPLCAVRVWSDPVAVGYPLGGVLLGSSECLAQDAHRLTEELVEEASSQVAGADGVEVDVRPLRGPAGPVLVDAAGDTALLVVGTRAAGAVSRTVLGSVSDHVLHHARCSVAVVPVPTPGDDAAPRVLAGVDHSPSSAAALSWAAEEAASRGAVLVPVHVRDEAWDDHATDLLDAEAAERRALCDAVPVGVGVTVRPEVVPGPVGRALVEAARPQDLLVVGTRGRRPAVAALLGSTSTYAVRHAACPVVVVR